jgi:hypothetical protein
MTKSRKRINKGTLVASTNSLNKIKSKRFVINVYFDNSYKITKSNIGNFRTCLTE